MKSLFGEEIPEVELPKKFKGMYQKFKQDSNYRKTESEDRCKNCHFAFRMSYHGKSYWKCEKMGVSHSEHTDIKVSNVCDLYKRRDVYE
jgi:hypothetical protein